MKHLSVANESLLPEVEKLLAEGIRVTLKVKGNSMLPFIRGGRDNVTLEAPAGISRGDIVLARMGQGRYVLHRVIKIKNNIVVADGRRQLPRHGTVPAQRHMRTRHNYSQATQMHLHRLFLHAHGRHSMEASAPRETLAAGSV